jgi:hypothetical protein
VRNRPASGVPQVSRIARLHAQENSRATVKMPTVARYFPNTTSQSLAGMVRSNSSVPCRRSSAQTLIVIAGTNTSRISGR